MLPTIDSNKSLITDELRFMPIFVSDSPIIRNSLSPVFLWFRQGVFADDCRAHTGELSLVKRRVSFHQRLGNDERKYAVAQKFKILI